MNKNAVVYLPKSIARENLLVLWKNIVRETIDSRWLTFYLLKRNYSAAYRQSVFGLLWAFIVPLLSVGMFIFLNLSGLFNIRNITIPYPLYAVASISLWQVFSIGIAFGANALSGAGGMLTKINFNRESLVFSSVAQGIVPSAIQVIVVLILFGFYQMVPPVTVFLVPFAVIPLLLLTIGLAFILSLINALLKDVGYGISTLVTFLLFITPILYEKPTSGFTAAMSTYNPLYYLVVVPRDLLIIGSTTELYGYFYSTLLALAILILCWTAFRVAQTRIAERI